MNRTATESAEVLIVGAGPSGAMAAVMLQQGGFNALVLERQKFPRFSIGESLLPQLMVFLENAGMADLVCQAGFQLKDGAVFSRNGHRSSFDFEQKFTSGPATTFQVKRADFDKLLADHAEQLGVEIRYQHEVLSVETFPTHCLVRARDEEGNEYSIKAGFILDASGFGRVLPRLLELNLPSEFPVRKSIFCHLRDHIDDPGFDRNKILISVHPQHVDLWYWLIPFSDGTCSAGVVGLPEYFDQLDGSPEDKILQCITAEPGLKQLLKDAEVVNEVREIAGYAANVKSLYGENYALLGNAGEFLDPIFSSGVTIALKSANLATSLLIRERSGEEICWESDYAQPLMKGIDTFRVFVDAWYDGKLQDIIFYPNPDTHIKEMICSVLAGYAWDESNPYVAKAKRRIESLAKVCRS